MSRKKISQREAMSLRHQVRKFKELINSERRVWGREYIGAIHIATITLDANSATIGALKTAAKLGHAVVAHARDGGEIMIYALPMESERIQ